MGGGGVPGPLRRPDAGGLPLRPAAVLPVVRRRRAGGADGDAGPHRAVPHVDGASAASPPRRSIGDCRLSAASTASPTSTDASPSNPAQYVRRPKVHPSKRRGIDRGELGAVPVHRRALRPMHAALAVLLGLNGLRVSEACATNIEDLGFERGHRTLRILGKGNKPADPARAAHGPDHRPGHRRTMRRPDPASPRRSTASTDAPPTAGSARSANEPGSDRSTPTCSAPRSSWPPSTPAYPSRRPDRRPPRRPRTTTLYDRRRQNFDRHAAYVVVAFVTSG